MTVSLPLILLALVLGAALAWGVAARRDKVAHGTMENLRAEAERLRIEVAELEADKRARLDAAQSAEEVERIQREAFEALASKVLKSNSEELTKQSKGQLETLVDPLNKSLEKLDTQVRTLEEKRAGAYGKLTKQLEQLGTMHTQLQTTTTQLAQALKSPTARGQWGELQLRRIVEMAGMTKHVDFDEQTSGEKGRPDMVVRLPRGGVIPVDAKVSMESYLAAMSESDPDARQGLLVSHGQAVKSRVVELGRKAYWEQFDDSPEFVVMFIPHEPCLAAAFEHDPTLLDFAIGKKVLVASPVSFLGLLKVVAYGWQEQAVAENAKRIAAAGTELHTRIVKFMDYVGKVGKHLRNTTNEYNKAVKSFESRVLPSARRLEEVAQVTDGVEAPGDVDTIALPSPEGASADDE